MDVRSKLTRRVVADAALMMQLGCDGGKYMNYSSTGTEHGLTRSHQFSLDRVFSMYVRAFDPYSRPVTYGNYGFSRVIQPNVQRPLCRRCVSSF